MSASSVPGRIWPVDVFPIGCDGVLAPESLPSAETMGFKAWNLQRMTALSLPVPPAFVIGSRYCRQSREDAATRRALWLDGIRALERATALALGDSRRPLLLSVRSGAPVSMPGMMETLLNIGLCDATVGGLLRRTGQPRLVWDAYHRLVAGFGEVVAGIPAAAFEAATTALVGKRDERELDFADLRALTRRFLDVYAEQSGRPFPQEPAAQLDAAIHAVFASWQSPKACEYRRLNSLSDDIGTAVTVQAMVFGNGGGQSGAGVGFTRDPATGSPELWVDFLFDAQGEDVVSGRRSADGSDALQSVLPATWTALQAAAHTLEQAFGDMQDFEFTVQDGRLFMLQTRSGKRTPIAAARIALDLADDGVIDAATACQRTQGLDARALTRSRLVADGDVPPTPLGRAATASSGVAIGEIALDGERAAARRAEGRDVVLVRRDAETSDIAAIESAMGLLTQRGARTSHAAVVARQLGKVCLVGCAGLRIDETTRTVRIGATTLHEGDLLTLDGNDGAFYAGALETRSEPPRELLAQLDALRSQRR